MKRAENLKAQIIAKCVSSGMRRTLALRAVVGELLSLQKPASLKELAERKGLKDVCDRATIFRILEKLEDLKLLKRFWFKSRTSYFYPVKQDEHQDFIICLNCEKIEIIKADCPFENNAELKKYEKRISQQSGYKKLEHELEFFGICIDCQ